MDFAALHRERLRPYVDPHLARRTAGLKHPVHDFMFEYYRYRPIQLLRWSAGSAALPAEKVPLVTALHRLLRATAAREGNFGCFGMHEWAMVHRSDTHGTRHPVHLRLGQAATDVVVESHRLQCSHFDAYRFFTPSAAPLNTLSPASGDREEFEQPACLHGNMDLYKHAFRLAGLIPSSLIADAFELAWDIRILDMRAAPYDMGGWTLDPYGIEWTPVRVETADGKAEYADAQRTFADRAAPIRAALIAECERLLGVRPSA
ncbi:3-methyladenine DNA glycosylase [Nocardioides sp. Kera G14]|uniref:3-methyladenine DNA glycosylase n=1 Tax=Nocardioides sp. Kera G14 TaxID=2884264 RepID=UPI001D1106A8|nr:3-methyladenine DNA glycosylase [Nocardioides sp. Kera G14]UDY22701.1 3-methyladenine DNA glycosylase [Nocardioides sp. Kera G14]